MNIKIENYEVECFETEQDLKFFLDVHKNDNVRQRFIYVGGLYNIPQEITQQFNEDVVVQIKRQNFIDVQSIIIIK